MVVWDAKIVSSAMILEGAAQLLGEEDDSSFACSQKCRSSNSGNLNLYCVSYFYVFLQLRFLMIL